MKKISLDKAGIYEYQQNREPYLLIDFATEVIPGKSAKGYKVLKVDEWFFKVHWPNDPNMPGMLQIEALVQMCSLSILTLPGNKGKVMYLVSADKLKFITATLCIRVGTKTVPYFSGEHINDDRWLVFPWEKLDSVPMQDYLVDKK